jgi:hypothetical protein
MLSALNNEIELLDAQAYKNIAVIPIKTPINYKFDILTLAKGFELGLVKVKECETSTVNTIIVMNNSITPLLLVDGEEVIGGDQNRIVNSTVLVAPQTEMKIPVNCTEHGRWGFKHDFIHSEYMANSRTRYLKALSSSENKDEQNAVWDSIASLEKSRGFSSKTQAMSESYDNVKFDFAESINEFKILDGQTGILIMIDGKIKGFEMFFNSEIYAQYHEKILKSYLIDTEINDSAFSINIDEAKSFITNAIDSDFSGKKSIGLETPYEFKNETGLGKVYAYKDEIIHLSYFSDIEELNQDQKDLEGTEILFDS